MVKLNELPPEIVEMVVRVGSDTEKRAQNRYEDLKSFARISPIFQYPAQRLMNERVVLRNVSTMASWLEERREDFVVKELTFESEDEGELEDQPDDLSMADMQRTIRTCPQGLQKLSILVIDDIEGSILSETNLKGQISLPADSARSGSSVYRSHVAHHLPTRHPLAEFSSPTRLRESIQARHHAVVQSA